MKIFKNKWFHQWTKKTKLDNKILKNIIHEISTGLYDAELGGFLYKKRIGTQSRGKRGGLRTIIAFKKEDKVFFMYGYAKKTRVNIDKKEKLALMKLANVYFSYSEIQIIQAIKTKELIEVL